MTTSLELKRTILIADDDRFVSVAYKTGLEGAGYRVLIANDGDAALKLLVDDTPDVVLLDLILPKLNGFEVLRAMRSDARLAAVPVIVFSSLTQESDQTEVRRLGAVDFIVKSDVTLNDLITRIGKVIDSVSTSEV